MRPHKKKGEKKKLSDGKRRIMRGRRPPQRATLGDAHSSATLKRGARFRGGVDDEDGGRRACAHRTSGDERKGAHTHTLPPGAPPGEGAQG